MKATQRDYAQVAPRAAQTARVFFFCGDEASAQDAANRMITLLPNPGERIELSGAELRRDPVRLGDEARSSSLFGGSDRHIWVRAQGDEAHDAVANLLAGEGEACPVLILATAATDKARTAKLLAERSDALVAMFHPPDLRSVTDAVRIMAGAAGLTMAGDLGERIARAAGLDTRLAQSEVTKLALYLDASPESPRKASVEAFEAIGAKTEDDGFGPLVNAVLGGETAKLARELRRMHELGINPVGLLLAFERRAAQLVQLAARMGPRGDAAGFIKAEVQARRVFFKEERELAVQLGRWRGKRLERLVEKLVGLHRALMANSQNAELLLAQGLAEIARVAAARA